MRAVLPVLALACSLVHPFATAEVTSAQCAADAQRCQALAPAKSLPILKTSVRYPICFYDTSLGAVDSARKAWPEYAKNLANAIQTVTGRTHSVVVVNSRSVVVRTTRTRHRQLERMWAALACVGQSGGHTADASRGNCEQFMKEVVVLKKEPVAAPACQTFLD